MRDPGATPIARPVKTGSSGVTRAALLALAAALAVASSKGPKIKGSKSGSGSSEGPLIQEKAKELGHPSLVIRNTTTCLIKVRLKGASRRRFFVVPRGAFRTLVAAGPYIISLEADGDCRIGVTPPLKAILNKKTRYFLRLPPKDPE